jgi:uncharacterized protein (DUF2252 family)
MALTHRANLVIDALTRASLDSISADPGGFGRKFRKMAASPFAFYRGSAALFYEDMNGDYADDSFLDARTRRVWIHGDLHAENFGTYLDAAGRFTFDVNDFDEAYIGPFIWDLKRFAASLALIGYAKAMSDDMITGLVTSFARSYVPALRAIAAGEPIAPITLANASGPLLKVLHRARLNTRISLLTTKTTIDDYDRRFSSGDGVKPIGPGRAAAVSEAFQRYLTTIPRRPESETVIKDIVELSGAGIGSAGLPFYNLLLEGRTQALENDVIFFMKQAQVPSVAPWIEDARISAHFRNQGQRTTELQRALLASPDPSLGYTELDGIGQLVGEFSPYAADLDWSDVNDAQDMTLVISDLGRATARLHSVTNETGSGDLVDFSTEDAILAVIGRDETAFVDHLVQFGHDYGRQVRLDHAEFVDLFRSGRLTERFPAAA